MFTRQGPDASWKQISIRVMIGSFIASVLFSLLDGALKSSVEPGHSILYYPVLNMYDTWVYDLRIVADNCLSAAAIVAIGAKFLETRTTFSIGFDKLDASKVAVQGPDTENYVWIGQRYPTQIEAQLVAEAFRARLAGSIAGPVGYQSRAGRTSPTNSLRDPDETE